MKTKNMGKNKSLLIVTLVYVTAIIISLLVFRAFQHMGILTAVFLADIAATLIVWLFGVAFDNASLYDPYWSLAPMIIIPFWMYLRNTALSFADILILIAVITWGMRLTLNWIIGWKGMSHIDWRYEMLKNRNPKIWQLTNLGGINLMPTILVYTALIPSYYFIFEKTTVNIMLYIGFAVCVISASIQYISDKQMKEHRLLRTDSYIDTGLWRYSRHPNYFGEVSFWWGIFIMQIGAVPNIYLSVIGAVLITLLFVSISIPMMEKHVSQKSHGYNKYKDEVSMLIPWFRKQPKH